MKKTLFRKLNFLIAIASIFAALVVGGCANLLSSTSSDDDSAPVNVVYPAVTVENGRGIVRGTLPQETSASTRTAMPDVPTISSYKVFAQNGSTTIEANVDNANKTFSISLPYGTWNVTAKGLLANNRVVYTQTQSVTVSATNPTVDLPFTSLSYSTNPDDGEGEISLTVTLDSSATSTITAIDYTLTKGEENITRQVSDTDLQAGTFKIERTTTDLGAWYLTINCYGDNANLVYRVDETVNVYANLTTDTFVGSAPYISGGAINITQAMLTEFQQTTLYVHATDGKDTNTGTQFDPLQTFNRAVELVNNSTRPAGTEFRIFLKSDVNDGADLELKAGKKLTVANAGNNNYTITSLGRNFTVAATSELTVKDIQFQKLRFVVNGAFTMNGGTISGNSVTNYGGGIYNEGTLTIIGGTISNCTTTKYAGGGIYNHTGATAEITDCTITNCTVNGTGGELSGGGIYNKGTLTIIGGEISGNDAGYGGGIYNSGSSATAEITDCTITGCTANGTNSDHGGGGISNTGTLTFSGGTIERCTTNHGKGGGIFNTGTLTITSSGTTISNCTAHNGGGIYNNTAATAEITDCTITYCTVTRSYGSGIYNLGTFKMTGGEISNNTAGVGGGIFNNGATGTLIITGVTISNCKAENNSFYAYGGGICNYSSAGSIEITNCTITNCTAYNGGGIYNRGSSVEITDSTISGCTASNNGGGIYNYGSAASTEITSGTISDCIATSMGGGIYNDEGTFTLEEGTISGNTATRQGNGAYVCDGGIIEMGGSAQFASDNEIYLANTSTTTAPLIQIASALTGTTPVATITLSVYTAGKQVLQASSGGTITSDICGKFALTPAPDGIEWEISPDSTGAQGVLNRNSLYVRGTGAGWYTENPAYTASAGSDSNSGSKSSPFATIQKAIEKVLEMNDGTSEYTIYVDGTITGGATATANGMGDISPDKDLLLKIESMSATTHATLDAEGSGRVLNINANATVALNNINIANGNAADKGGGINNLGTLTITGGTITGCTASSGGGIYNQGSLTITDGTISNCTATNGSGIYNDGMLTMSDGTITGNTSTNRGGGVYNNRTFTMTVGTISKNKSKYSAGVFVSSGATFTMTDGTISENISERSGAGVSIDTGGSFTMQGGTINGNTSNDGYGGGGVYNEGTFTITGGTITGNKAPNATDGGGGINNHGGTLTMSGGTITGNTAGTNGGGVYNNSSATFTMDGTATISGNTAQNGNGAYIVDGGTLKMGGSARFASDNDVYLKDNTSTTAVPTIQIASALIGTTPVATITPSVYTAGKQVLSLATGSTTTLANEYQKFAVSDEKWGIDDEGKLFSDLWVSSTGDDTNGNGTKTAPFATLQRAIDEIKTLNDSTASYTIHIVGNVVGTSAIGSDVPAQEIFITGTSSSTDVLDGNGANQVILNVACTAPVELTNIKLTNGANGGIRVETGTSVVLEADAVVSGNSTTTNGGGVYVYGGTLTMTGGTISNNTAHSGGGVFVSGNGTFTMTGGTISNNEASGANGFGGGVCNDGNFIMIGGTISDCTAVERGGGVYVSATRTFTMSGTAKITNCKTTSTSITDSGGGGIYNDGTAQIQSGTISGCTAGLSGGGVYNGETLTMTGGTITGCTTNGTNSLNSGGGIWNTGTLTVSDVTINKCSTHSRGGGICIAGGTFTMTGSTISKNSVSVCGGGVYVADGAQFTMQTGSEISNNTAGNGGGVYVTGNAGFTMNDGTIKQNVASYAGGGISIDGGTLTMTGGTISNNESGASVGGSGGGVYINDGTFTMTDGAISGNTSRRGAGVSLLLNSVKFEMSGGEITGNTATESGGGVYITNGTFTITGGTITGNTGNNGGKAGVEKFYGTFNNNGGTVQDD